MRIFQASCDLSVVCWVCWRGQSVCSIHTLLFKCHNTERTAQILSPPPSRAGLFDQIGGRKPSRLHLTLTWGGSEVICQVSQAKLAFTLLHTGQPRVEVTKGAVYEWLIGLDNTKHPTYWYLLCWRCGHYNVQLKHLMDTYKQLQNTSLSFS